MPLPLKGKGPLSPPLHKECITVHQAKTPKHTPLIITDQYFYIKYARQMTINSQVSLKLSEISYTISNILTVQILNNESHKLLQDLENRENRLRSKTFKEITSCLRN